MDLSRGYNLSASERSQLRFLDWIAENGGATPGTVVMLGPLFEDRDDNEASAIAGHLGALDDAGYIDLQETFSWGGYSCVVRPSGAALIQRVRAARGDILARRKAARDAFLHWLHDRTLHGARHPALSDFMSSPYAAFFETGFTATEIKTAVGWLHEEGYIKGTRVLSGELAGLSITNKGERLIESGRSVNGEPPTVQLQGSSEVAAASSHGSVHMKPAASGPIFVVHGRDHHVLHLAVRVLQQTTGREVIVLHEQANAGRTILEKFEAHAVAASYAVVLLTGDDHGGLSGGPARSRGRQNVVFELGFFFGKLGRERVTVLIDEDVEQPSDINGLVYIGLDVGGAWKHQLCRELEAAGISVNYSRIP